MQRRRIGKQTRMTKDEVKQEHKQTEGDPMLKGADPVAAARRLRRNRMMADVPTADVVLVNPTHVAVALRYDPERGAPRVVARGAGVDRASDPREGRGAPACRWSRDVPLARALYTLHARSARRSRPSCSPRSPRCSRSSSADAPAARGGGEHAQPAPHRSARRYPRSTPQRPVAAGSPQVRRARRPIDPATPGRRRS